MARKLLGEVELRLRDRLTPGAKSAAEALRGVKSAADSLGTGTRLNGLAGSLMELARLGKEVRGSFAALHIPAEVQAGLRQMNAAGRGLPRLSTEATAAAVALKGLKASIAGGFGAERFRADVNGITGDLRRLASAGRGLAGLATSTARAAAPLGHLRTTLASVRAEAAAPIRLNLQYDRSFARRIAADLEGVRSQARRPITLPPIRPVSPGPAPAGGGAHRTGGPGMVGVYAGGAAANRITRGGQWAATQGADQMREDARAWASGMTPDERAGIIGTARSMSGQYPSVRQSTLQEVLREGYYALGGPRRGGMGKMADIAPDLAAALVNLQTRVGPRGAVDQLTGFMRGAQNMGFADDLPRLRQILDAMVRAQAVEGREFNFRDLFTFARRSKSAGLTLDDDFLMNVAPALIADVTPATAGVALGTLLSRQTAGQNSRAADAAQREYGIRNDQGLVNNSTLLRNPFRWIDETLVPALRAKGIDTNDATQLGRVLPQLFRDQTAQGLITRMILQADEFRDASDAYRRAKPSKEAAEELRARDPYVALEASLAQLSNAFAEVSKPIVSTVIPALNSFAAGLNGIAQWIAKNPQWAPRISGGAALGVGGAALGASWLALRGVGSALGIGGGTAAGGAFAAGGSLLATIARASPAVAAILGIGAAGVPIGQTFEGVKDGEQHNFGRRIRRGADAMARKGRDERFGPLATPEEHGPPAPPQLDPLHGRMVQRRDELQRQIDALRAGGEPAAGSPAAQTLSNLNAELAALGARIAEAETAVRNAGQSLGNAAAQGVQGTTGEASAAGASVGRAILEGLRSAIGNIGGPGSAPPREAPAAGAAPSPPGRALGGPVSAGQLYTVGEAGPELFQPGANGSIIPNHALPGPAGSAGGRSGDARQRDSRPINITISGPVVGAIHAAGMSHTEITDKIADELKTALAGAFSDGDETWG